MEVGFLPRQAWTKIPEYHPRREASPDQQVWQRGPPQLTCLSMELRASKTKKIITPQVPEHLRREGRVAVRPAGRHLLRLRYYSCPRLFGIDSKEMFFTATAGPTQAPTVGFLLDCWYAVPSSFVSLLNAYHSM